jgi:hypothetical protein
MQFIGPSSNEEMVAVFLRGELGSPRYADTIQAELNARGLDRALIEIPDLNDRMENVQRAAVLFGYRPWLVHHGLLENWPSNTVWQWVELVREDIENLRYITYSYWDELSNGTHLVRDGARSVQAWKLVSGVSNDGFWEVARRIDAGELMPPLIVLSGGASGPHTLIEGHVRATSCLLAKHPRGAIKALFRTVRLPGGLDSPRP